MDIKIKVQPADFVVEEQAALPLRKKGSFAVYLMKKQGWNTVDLLFLLSRQFRLPFNAFSYGGKKDRHALTAQYIAIRNASSLEIHTEKYQLQRIGFMDRPMGPDLLSGNKFTIVVRHIAEQECSRISKELELLVRDGFPNYFDEQRFGSYDSQQGFIAEKLLKGHLLGALKVYLTAIHPEDKKEEKERKRFFAAYWKEWPVCQNSAKTRFEKETFSLLSQYPQHIKQLFSRIPREELSLFISAYQSFLWNELLRQASVGS